MQQDEFDAYAIDLLQQLLRFESITPSDAGVMYYMREELEKLGFTCEIMEFSETDMPPVLNLYARYGDQTPNLCFAGHLDVVPPGDKQAWKHQPFAGQLDNGMLYGRGAVDMKGAVAAFIGAVKKYCSSGAHKKGSISLLLTGDEEGEAINGTNKMLSWLHERGERLDACIVGEPTSENLVGDTIKVGRRGSANFRLKVYGIQGHVAYPQKADNPVHHLVSILDELYSTKLDEGTDVFLPSSLQITTVDVGNPTSNIIPDKASAAFNVRFNDRYTLQTLTDWVDRICSKPGCRYELEVSCNATAFTSPSGSLRTAVLAACADVLLQEPGLSTSGGTSDARFIHQYCETIELGLCNALAHKVDECVSLDEMVVLGRLYHGIIERYLSA